MALVRRGSVEHGQVVFQEPLDFPDGVQVLVMLEMTETSVASDEVVGFAALSSFGIWADREDVADSAA